MVVVEKAAEPFLHFDLPYSLRHRPADNLIAYPLMTALVMVVSRVLGRCCSAGSTRVYWSTELIWPFCVVKRLQSHAI